MRLPLAIQSGQTITCGEAVLSRRSSRRSCGEGGAGRPRGDALRRSNRYVDGLEAAQPQEGYVCLDGGDTMIDPSTSKVVLRGLAARCRRWTGCSPGGPKHVFRVPSARSSCRNRTGNGLLLYSTTSASARVIHRSGWDGEGGDPQLDVRRATAHSSLLCGTNMLYASTHQMRSSPVPEGRGEPESATY